MIMTQDEEWDLVKKLAHIDNSSYSFDQVIELTENRMEELTITIVGMIVECLVLVPDEVEKYKDYFMKLVVEVEKQDMQFQSGRAAMRYAILEGYLTEINLS